MRKRMLSIMLAVVVTFTAMGSNVSAAELGAAVDESIQTQTEETETADADAESETEKQGEEAAAEDTDAESETTEEESTEEISKEDVADSETEGENQEKEDNSEAVEDADAESETVEEEVNVEDSEEDETEIGAGVAEMSLTTSDTDIASGQYTENGSNVAWVIDANGKLTVEGTGDIPGYESAPWYSEVESIKSAEIKVTGMTNAAGMFFDCTNLTSVDLSNFDTSKVTGMSSMFSGCSSLIDLDLSSFDTSNVKNMYGMFYGCKSLLSVDLSNFDTSKVTGMSSMFSGCSSLTDLDLSNFDTSEAWNLDSMFKGCTNLVSVDISGFKTREKTWVNMYEMFEDCSSLTSVNLKNVDTSNAFSMKRMFQGCSSLTDLDLSSFDTSNVESMDYMFHGCSSLTGLDLSSFDTGKVTDMHGMFWGCSSLTSLDISNFDTSKVTDMHSMFLRCSSLTSLNVSSFDTSKVIDMGNIFSGCSSLTSLNLSNFDTSNVGGYIYYADGSVTVGSMDHMFYGCSSLTSLDLSSFNTSKVENMERMFSDCSSLSSLNLGNFDTGKVVNMSGMFYGCRSLTDLDLSSFDTGNLGSMGSFHYGVGIEGGGGMFEGCESLISLNVSSFNTSNVGSMCFMFRDCKSLTNLDLSSFNTSNVRDMQYMFDGCSSLTSLDISGFNTSNLTYNHWLFHLGDCEHLTTIYTPYMLTQGIGLRGDWYNSDGEKITELPRSLGYSIVIMKNRIPYTSTIVAAKTKTTYECGDTLNVDDLTVYYYNEKGKPIVVTEGYSTNADDIDMSTIGKKILRITYNDMTAEVDIIVGNIYTVTFAGSGKDDIAEGTADWLEAGADYTFTLVKEEGSVYTVSAMMGEEAVTLNPDETGNIYTVSNVSGNLVITIEKTAESGLSISFVNANDKKITYTGKAVQPLIRVRYNGKRLISGTDYTIKYTNNIKVGTTAKITVTGKGNFAGSNSSTTFEIMPRDIADVTLCGVAADADGKETLTLASGAALTPVLYYNNIKLTNKDYVIKDASGTEIAGKKLGDSDNNTAIKIEGKSGGNFTGSREVKLNVVDKKNLTKFTVTVDTTKLNTLTYDGDPHYIHEISGAITVKASDAAKTNMEYGKDYTIVYPSDVISAGTKKFTVVGLGLYTGSVSKSYTIKPAKEAALSVYYDGSIVTGNKITTPFTFASSGIAFSSKLTVTESKGNALGEGRDYKVSYSGNKQVGTKAKCTITFLGNYKGHAKQIVGFEIAKADLSKAEVIIADKAYTGKAGIYKSVPYVIEDKDDANVLLKSSNYKTTYYTEDPTNHDNAAQMKGKNKVGAGGTVWVKLEAKGKNYSGTQIVSYKVREVAYDLSKAKITFKDTEGKTVKKMPYTGSKITDKHIKAVVNGNLAEDNEDIEVIYVDNIKKGKATVIIKGTDTDTCAYAGCKTAAFSIVARSFSLH